MRSHHQHRYLVSAITSNHRRASEPPTKSMGHAKTQSSFARPTAPAPRSLTTRKAAPSWGLSYPLRFSAPEQRSQARSGCPAAPAIRGSRSEPSDRGLLLHRTRTSRLGRHVGTLASLGRSGGAVALPLVVTGSRSEPKPGGGGHHRRPAHVDGGDASGSIPCR
jgi:hypothetical protein